MTNLGATQNSGKSIKVKLIFIIAVMSVIVIASIVYLMLELRNEAKGARLLVEKTDQALLVVNTSKHFSKVVCWLSKIYISDSSNFAARLKKNETKLFEGLDSMKTFVPDKAGEISAKVSKV